jgi:protein phosphatase
MLLVDSSEEAIWRKKAAMKGCNYMVGMLSDIGKVRKLNEDYLGYFEDSTKKIYVVADGVGGHNAGEVASKLAVETIIEYIKSIDNINDIDKVLVEGVVQANKSIYDFSKTNTSLKGMGTTVTACLVKDGKMIVANVGDSRCYIIDRTGINQITKDHSLVQQLVDSGSITQEEAAVHPNKNIITRSLGTYPSVEIDTFMIDLDNIFKVILCTDGLSNLLSADEIYEITMNSDNTSACRKLIDISNQRGGRDNTTVIIFEGECKDDRYFTRE